MWDEYYERLEAVAPILSMEIVRIPLVVSELKTTAAISECDKQTIEAEPTDMKRSKALIDAVLRRSDRSFLELIRALRDTKQSHAADLLAQGNQSGVCRLSIK